ncbi:hypothetical protein J3L16_15460 [Alteromonas sp. 5E99-2]|uniref:hypothetical protein n=1 Tax=Alteromonas sp. 5E99-2 TaxID=2817683 RepID=UPI001A990AEB|nr:hypothetical protein [Alteromonas sp. 5E99-2]MBO1257081.1 hypothetical protein [Alteromonas sp. 5E99-2]
MELSISFSQLKANLDVIRKLIANISAINVTHIEYRTFDEGYCNADFFVLSKNEIKDELEAFIVLWTYQLHFYEEWKLTDTNVCSTDSIVNVWMLPTLEKYLFNQLPPDQVSKEIDSMVRSILLCISETSDGDKSEAPERWGVFKNDMLVSSSTSLSELGLSDINFGIGLSLDWNEIDIMYHTDKDYVFYSWSTGA